METFETTNPDVVIEKKAFNALKKNISVKFVNVLPTEALNTLGEKTGLSFSLDKESLSNQGTSSETPINLSFDNQPTSVALHHIAKSLDSVWYFDEGAFVVGTAEHEKEKLLLRMYPIGKLLPGVKMAIERLASEPPPPKPAGGGGGQIGGGGFFGVSDTPLTLRDFPRSNPSISRNAQASGSVTPTTLEPDASASRLMRSKSQTILCQFGGGGGGGLAGNQQVEIPTVHGHFATLLTSVITGPWQNTDGEGGTIELLQNILVVRHTRRVHADVESLLRALEAAFAQPLKEPLTMPLANATPEADQHVRQQLARPIDAEFKETNLTEFAKQIGEQLGVPMSVDIQALENHGIGTEIPVTFSAKGLAAESLLSHALKPLNLTHVIEHGHLVITTVSAAHQRLTGTIHDVRHLLNRGLHPDRLTQAIESATAGPWVNVDGEGGSLNLFSDTLLIVHQSSRTHAEVTKFLASLNSQLRDQPEVPRALLPQSKSNGPTKPRANIPNAPQTGGPTTTPPTMTAPPTKTTTNNGPEYDGKSIEQWFAVLDTERSPSRLAEAFDAIRFLAEKTHFEKIAERALHVFRNVDCDSTFGNGKESRQVSSIADSLLRGLPPTILAVACARELIQGNELSHLFVLRHGMRSLSNSGLETKDLGHALLQTSRDQHDTVRELSVSYLATLIYRFPDQPLASDAKSRCREVLSDKSPTVVLAACRGLFASASDGPSICDAISPIVTGSHAGQQYEALWLLAVMGPSAEKAIPSLNTLLLAKDEDHPERNSQTPRPNFFSKYSAGGGSYGRNPSDKELAIIALARMGKAANSALPTIQQALEKRKDSISRGSVDVVSTVRDLLLAAKARIEEQTIPNAERLAKNELTQDDLDLMESTYRTLRLESEMLRHFFGINHPSVRELDARMKLLLEAYDQAIKQGQRPQKKEPNDAIQR
ncbi:MAG: hypothetical protein NT013_28505 [Planctomycetia bacterium]|nr:hypothetical protein [Planctomycetia bacterium]